MANTPLQNLQAAYVSVTAKIAEAFANPKPSYSVDGVSKNWNEYYEMLTAQEKALRAIPGVATDTTPIFTVMSVGR